MSAVVLASLPVTGSAQIVFRNVNVVPMTTSDVLHDQTVVIEGGKITAITSSAQARIPAGATVIPATGKFLMPGLAEMHSHIPDPVTPEFRRSMDLFLANGVTTVRGLLGLPGHPAVRNAIERGDIVAPRLLVAGSSLNGRSVVDVDDAVRQVREQKAAGFDSLKIHPGLTMDEFLAIARTGRELAIPLAGHIPPTVGVSIALDMGIRSVEHLDGYLPYLAFGPTPTAETPMAGEKLGLFDVKLAPLADARRIPEVVARTKAAGTWTSPTEGLVELFVGGLGDAARLATWPELQYVPAAVRKEWLDDVASTQAATPPEAARTMIALRRELLRALHKAGAGMLLASDAPQVMQVPGFSLQRELRLLVDAGFTPYEALQMGTTAAATFAGFNTGAVVPGRDADLLLLDANPLVDIANVERIDGVMVRGLWLPRAELDAMLTRHRSVD